MPVRVSSGLKKTGDPLKKIITSLREMRVSCCSDPRVSNRYEARSFPGRCFNRDIIPPSTSNHRTGNTAWLFGDDMQEVPESAANTNTMF